jgi:hypothetical protein
LNQGESETTSKVMNGMNSFDDCEKRAGKKKGTGRSGSAADVAEPAGDKRRNISLATILEVGSSTK